MNLIDLVFVYLWLLGIFIAINFSIFEIRTDGDTILVFLYFAISLLCFGIFSIFFSEYYVDQYRRMSRD